MDNVRAHALVTGFVQGVFFRATTVETAKQIGDITGWVRNMPDGRVEVVAEGPRTALENLTQWLYKGPPSASVTGVELFWEKATGEFLHFTVRH